MIPGVSSGDVRYCFSYQPWWGRLGFTLCDLESKWFGTTPIHSCSTNIEHSCRVKKRSVTMSVNMILPRTLLGTHDNWEFPFSVVQGSSFSHLNWGCILIDLENYIDMPLKLILNKLFISKLKYWLVYTQGGSGRDFFMKLPCFLK